MKIAVTTCLGYTEQPKTFTSSSHRHNNELCTFTGSEQPSDFFLRIVYKKNYDCKIANFGKEGLAFIHENTITLFGSSDVEIREDISGGPSIDASRQFYQQLKRASDNSRYFRAFMLQVSLVTSLFIVEVV